MENRSYMIIFISLVILGFAFITIVILYKYKKKTKNNTKFSALINNKNVCYINSTVQLLYSNEEFTQMILEKNIPCFTWCMLHNIFKSMQNGDKEVDCSIFVGLESRDEHFRQFELGIMQDVLDFYKAFIDSLVEQLTTYHHQQANNVKNLGSKTDENKDNKNEIVDKLAIAEKIRKMFYIQVHDKNVNSNTPSYIFNLYKATSHYGNRIDDLDYDRLQKGERVDVSNFPELLNIALSRSDSSPIQIHKSITFFDTEYKLLSFIEHTTKLSYEHFICYAERGNRWYMFDDDNIKEVKRNVLDKQLNNNRHAYVLTYVKQPNK